MKKLFIITWAICVALSLSANKKILYQQDFETVTSVEDTGWSFGGSSLSLASDGFSKYLELSLGYNNDRSGQVTWGKEIFMDENGESVLIDGKYNVSFDFCIRQGSNNYFDGCITVFTNHTPVLNQSYRNPWSPVGYWQNYLFDMSQADNEPLSYIINGDTENDRYVVDFTKMDAGHRFNSFWGGPNPGMSIVETESGNLFYMSGDEGESEDGFKIWNTIARITPFNLPAGYTLSDVRMIKVEYMPTQADGLHFGIQLNNPYSGYMECEETPVVNEWNTAVFTLDDLKDSEGETMAIPDSADFCFGIRGSTYYYVRSIIFYLNNERTEPVESDLTDYAVPTTFSAGEWYTVSLDVDVNSRKVEYTVTSLDGDTVNSGTLIVPENNTNGESISMYAEGLFLLLARFLTIIDVDNIVISYGSPELEVDFSYDGRFLAMESKEPDAVITYRFDRFPEFGDAIVYDGTPIDLSEIQAISSFAVSATISKQGFYNTKTYTYNVEYFGGEGYAWTSANGQLNRCYVWNDGKVPGYSLRVSGCMGAEDYSWLCTQAGIKILDIGGVYETMSNGFINNLPDGSLALPNLVYVILPQNIRSCGERVFGEGNKLCAVSTRDLTGFPEKLIKNVDNPNLIVYNNAHQMFSDEIYSRIIDVRNSHATDKVVLHDGYPFYCPIEFSVDEISYTRDFKMQTGINGECAGWETIALPFEVETITHDKGELAPFLVRTDEDLLHFWLYSPDTTGWLTSHKIRAYRPYLIAMPNNPAYYLPFNVSGKVTFSAKNVTIGVTPENTGRDLKGSRKMYASFLGEDKSTGVLAVNDRDYTYNGTTYAPGSHFVSGERDVRPFEAYVMAERALTRMAIFTRSEVETLTNDMEIKVWNEGNTICILSGFTTKLPVYNTMGQVVRIADVHAGETMRIDDLNAGIYIVAGYKILIH